MLFEWLYAGYIALHWMCIRCRICRFSMFNAGRGYETCKPFIWYVYFWRRSCMMQPFISVFLIKEEWVAESFSTMYYTWQTILPRIEMHCAEEGEVSCWQDVTLSA